jgi:hypothetical protein
MSEARAAINWIQLQQHIPRSPWPVIEVPSDRCKLGYMLRFDQCAMIFNSHSFEDPRVHHQEPTQPSVRVTLKERISVEGYG